MASSILSLPKLRISPHKVISAQIYDFLRKHITETNITPGTILSENSLSKHFNVSRQPVREALMRLSYEGMLRVMPQRGSVVERISVSEIRQTVFVRTAIEKECVLNITNLKPKDREECLLQLERVLQQQKRLLQDEEDKDIRAAYLRLDDLFHERLCAISGTNMAWNTIQSLKGQMDRIRFLTFDKDVTPPETVTHEHEEIFAHLKTGDMKQCLVLLSQHLSNIIDTQKPIIRAYSDWFTPESLNMLRRDEAEKVEVKAKKTKAESHGSTDKPKARASRASAKKDAQ